MDDFGLTSNGMRFGRWKGKLNEEELKRLKVLLFGGSLKAAVGI